MLKHWLTITGVALACVACTTERSNDTPEACFDYSLQIQPILNAACLECHGPGLAEGEYSVFTRADTFARRSDGTPRVEATRDALLLVAARGEIEDHPVAEASDLAVVERWLVDCESNTLSNDSLHPRGWLNRESTDFHGARIRDASWDFDICAECHGDPDEASGGPSGISCTTCHTEGATACSTCHGVAASDGAPGPALDGSVEFSSRGVGAHRSHQNGRLLEASVECEDCHVVPESWDDPGHIFNADGTIDDGPAEVVFGAAAGRSLEGLEERRTEPPSYDADTGTCDNVYCHAAVVGDTSYQPPVWTEIAAEPACDTCHDLPPGGTHAEETAPADCVICHPLLIGAQTDENVYDLLDPSLHIDGRLSLGNGNKSCSACHGSATNSAPPLGLNGETSTDDPQVGAHQAHANASQFRGPIDCHECHIMPAGPSYIGAVIAPGHVDTTLPSEVFPTGFGGLGGADGAAAAYARPNCTNSYCHGGGAGLAADTSPGILRALDWTDVGNGTVVCGACHGLPPDNGTHPLTIGPTPITRAECYQCHFRTIDENGNLIFDGLGNSNHIDGEAL